MMKLVKKIIGFKVIKDILLVASGTSAAQIISILFIPLIARIYGPEEYGILGVFMSGVAIVGTIAALTYPTAIVLPKDKQEAKSLIRVSLFITIVLFFISLIILLFWSNSIVTAFNLESIEKFILLFPFVILFSGLFQIVQQWMIRSKQFKIIAGVTMQHAIITNSSKLFLGLYYPIALVLILVSTIGIFLQSILYILKGKLYKAKLMSYFIFSRGDLTTLKKYKDFPLYRAPQVFINAASQNLPVILLSAFFGPIAAGFYSLSRSVLTVPVGFIGKAVGDVLYPRLSEMYNSGLSIKSTLFKSTIIMFLIGIIPFGLVIIFGPWFFGIIFGQEWYIAGEYARWMSIWLLFMFINRPVVVAIPILGLQKGFLIYEIITTFLKIISLIITIYISGNSLIAVSVFSIMGVLSYIYLIIWVLKNAK